jgi:two-component system, NarL family, sensor kinase
VRDAGAAGATWTPGVGLASMRERAEIGGSCTAAATPAGGLVIAHLPL